MNLTSWKPGQSGNPRGRPRSGEALSDCLRRELEKPAPEKVNGSTSTCAEAVAAALVRLAIGGDVRAIGLLFARVEGAPPAHVSISNLSVVAESRRLMEDLASDEEGMRLMEALYQRRQQLSGDSE